METKHLGDSKQWMKRAILAAANLRSPLVYPAPTETWTVDQQIDYLRELGIDDAACVGFHKRCKDYWKDPAKFDGDPVFDPHNGVSFGKGSAKQVTIQRIEAVVNGTARIAVVYQSIWRSHTTLGHKKIKPEDFPDRFLDAVSAKGLKCVLVLPGGFSMAFFVSGAGEQRLKRLEARMRRLFGSSNVTRVRSRY